MLNLFASRRWSLRLTPPILFSGSILGSAVHAIKAVTMGDAAGATLWICGALAMTGFTFALCRMYASGHLSQRRFLRSVVPILSAPSVAMTLTGMQQSSSYGRGLSVMNLVLLVLINAMVWVTTSARTCRRTADDS